MTVGQTSGRRQRRDRGRVEFYRYILVDMSPASGPGGDGGSATGSRSTRGAQARDGKIGPRRLASVLGWFSLGLGLAELLAPDRVARLVGIRETGRSQVVLRALGARELASGVGMLLARRGRGWAWARVAGDAMDLTLLGRALAEGSTSAGLLDRATRWIRSESQPSRQRGALALVAVLGVTALDVWCGLRLRGAAGAGGLKQRGIEVKRAITVNRPAGELYAFWRDLRNLPRFMRHVHSVEPLGDGRSHWVLKEPGGTTVEWDAEIVADRPGELIAWRSLPGASVTNAGSVRFVPAPRAQGTEIHVDLRYEPPFGKLGKIAAKLAMVLGEAPAEQVADDLRRFKQIAETGEIARSDASIWGIALMQHPAQPPKQLPAELAKR